MTSEQAVSKRKLHTTDGATRKKLKAQHLSIDDLPWKVVSHTQEAGFDNTLEGMMELEEVDGVEVSYEETDVGKVVRFNVADGVRKTVTSNGSTENSSSSPGPSNVAQDDVAEVEAFDTKMLLPNWHAFDLHPQLARSLYTQHFTNPTPIQAKALPAAMKGRDVIGVAETGSGKTLAYGLPILHSILTEAMSQRSSRDANARRPVRALILAPTRELALQVSSHLSILLNPADVPHPNVKQEDTEVSDILSVPKPIKGKAKATEAVPKVQSTPKQGKRPPLDDALASQIKHLKFLVLDEADRMIETGHFAELENILRLTLRQKDEDEIEPEPTVELVDEAGKADSASLSDGLQTFVFSATLSKDLQRNLKRKSRAKSSKKSKPASTLDDLLLRLDFRDPNPEVIDLSPEGGVVSTLRESQINCLSNDKDNYLYYFLLRYPGRSLVFFSSIDGIRRLMPLMDLLGLKAFPLHSQLEQRQRLKNLDRFKTTPNSILLATDIAARGLDIPAVDHVIHYQIPRSADVYVHRNGRTARAARSGFSLLMCAPDERRLVRALLGSLGRQEEDIPEMSVELYLLDQLKVRIQIARQIDSAQHKIKKENHEKNWIRKAAEEMEVELDSDLAPSSDDEERVAPSKKQRRNANAKTAALKEELKTLLAQPLIARGISARYITSGSRPVVDDIIAGEYHETMVGLPKSVAGSDVAPSRRRKAKTKQQPEYEEWSGFDS
ncbi:hypothetical protein EIP86_006836 [Pleurotus ostreatoroseus]|nr:hypothetical protein EIP86_006836 [Pleurotus ostreatoroseus]